MMPLFFIKKIQGHLQQIKKHYLLYLFIDSVVSKKNYNLGLWGYNSSIYRGGDSGRVVGC